MRISNNVRKAPLAMLAALVTAAVGSSASAQVPGLVLDPTSGPIGTVVKVTGTVSCDHIPVGGELNLRLVRPDAGLQTATDLGSTTIQPGSTISTSVTIPSTASELRLGEGIFDVPVTEGLWEIQPSCSTGEDFGVGGAPFTVTSGTTTTSSSSTTSTSSSSSTSTTAVASTTSTISVTSTTLTVSTPTSSTASLNVAEAAPGQTVVFAGEGFAAGSQASLTFESTPVALGVFTADGAGRVSATVAIPIGAAPGPHHIIARGVGPSGGAHQASVALTVVKRLSATGSQATRGGLPRTGSNLGQLAGLAGLLMGFGAALEVWVRTRRATYPTS